MWHKATQIPADGADVIGIKKLTREKVFCFYDDFDACFLTKHGGREVEISHWCYDETGWPEKEQDDV
jgi:hypothetical protein